MIRVIIEPTFSRRWVVIVSFDDLSWGNLLRTHYGDGMGEHIKEDLARALNEEVEQEQTTFVVVCEGDVGKIKEAIDAVVQKWQAVIKDQQEHESRPSVELTYDL